MPKTHFLQNSGGWSSLSEVIYIFHLYIADASNNQNFVTNGFSTIIWPKYHIIQVSNLLAMTGEIILCCGWDYRMNGQVINNRCPILYTLPQKKHNFSEIAFLLEKSVGRWTLGQMSSLQSTWPWIRVRNSREPRKMGRFKLRFFWGRVYDKGQYWIR